MKGADLLIETKKCDVRFVSNFTFLVSLNQSSFVWYELSLQVCVGTVSSLGEAEPNNLQKDSRLGGVCSEEPEPKDSSS